MGGQVQGADDPGQGQEGGIPMSGAAQPTAATPGQRMQNAGNLVQMLLMHGMKKHNLMGPDGKPQKVGAYAFGGMVRSFALGGSLDDTETQPEATPGSDETGGGNEPASQGAIPSVEGAPAPGAQGPGSVASTGSRTPSVMQYVTGADAPPDQVMDQLHTSFKKGGRSGNEAALGTVAAAAEKSPDLGFSVVQGYRKRYDKSRAAAAQALDMGNLDGGVSHLNEAFNNLPTQENANFSHDGQNVNASLDGQAYKMSPKLASGLLAKGNGGHFDNIMFTGLQNPLSTIGATSAAADKMSMSAGNPSQPGQMAQSPGAPPAQGTQVAQNVTQHGYEQLLQERVRGVQQRDTAEAGARNARDLESKKAADAAWYRLHPTGSSADPPADVSGGKNPGQNPAEKREEERNKFIAKTTSDITLQPADRAQRLKDYDAQTGYTPKQAATPAAPAQGSPPPGHQYYKLPNGQQILVKTQ